MESHVKLVPLSFRKLLSLGMFIQKNPLDAYQFLHETYGDMVYCPWVGRRIVFLFNPEHIKHVLKDNHTNYRKSSEYSQLRPLLGDGLLTSEGELWKNQRKIMAKQFHAQTIDLYIGQIQHRILKSMEQVQTSKAFDMSAFFSALTFEIAGEIFFGAQVEQFSSEVSEALHVETQRISKRVRRILKIPMFIPTRENREGRAAIKSLDRIVKAIIAEDHSNKSPNVLTKLMNYRPSISHKQIRDEVMTLLLAGHETTSNTLMWASWYLGRNPQWQEELHGEISEFKKPAHELTRAELFGLKKFRWVINESLRIMPPIPLISRKSQKLDVIGGTEIPKGTNIVCLPWVTHKDPRFWIDPLEWRPQRFEGREERKDDFTFFPFARGARSCVGEDIAMVETTAILAQLIENYSWKVAPGFSPVPVHHLTLRSENGMELIMSKR